MRKIFLVVILILSIITVSCATHKVNENPSIAATANYDYSILETDKHNKIIINGVGNNDLNYFIWQEYILKKYDVEVSLLNKSKSIQYTDVLNGLNELCYLQKDDIAKLYQQKEGYLILNEYLVNNEVWNNLPDYFKNLYTDKDGNIIAVAADDDSKLIYRFYDQEILNSIEMDIPETVNELYEILLLLRQKNDDATLLTVAKNNINDNYFSNINDIFNANGIQNAENIIEYSIHNNAYFAVGTSEDFKDTLIYIDALLNNNSIRFVAANNMNVDIYEDNFTTRGKIPKSTFQHDFIASVILKGNYKTNIIPINRSSKGYILSTYSEDPSEVINHFISTFYTKKGYLDAYLGNEQNYEYKEDEKFAVAYDAKINSRIISYLEAMDIGVLSNASYYQSIDQVVKNAKKQYRDKKTEIELLTSKQFLYNVPFFQQLEVDQYMVEKPASFYTKIFDGFNEASIDEMCDAYQVICQKAGLKETIEKLNISHNQ